MLILDRAEIRLDGFTLSADWSLPKGARAAIIGPSGAGKSTLLNAVAGFVPLSTGRIKAAETDITETPPAARPITMLFQDGNLFPHLTIAQNVGLALDPGLKLTANQWQAVEDSLARTGLTGFGPRRPASLSGGQQSRAALARALLRNRPLLLLDEPFSALGPALRLEMLDLVAEICTQSEMTLLMVTHTPDDALRIANQTVLVADGTAATPTPTRDLLDNPPPVLRDYLGLGGMK
ncbi:thiamine ABC transporter ATP-binding protein [Halovulum sp. GXIMD14793]